MSMDLSKSYDYFQPEKDTARIHIIGCGSVGATVAENLARCGITKFTLWDFDTVEPHNLANQIFRQHDIGKTKVEALLGGEVEETQRKVAFVTCAGGKNANRKFERRFNAVESALKEQGVSLASAGVGEMEAAWQAVKRTERA